jgi:hypothetical protein
MRSYAFSRTGDAQPTTLRLEGTRGQGSGSSALNLSSTFPVIRATLLS